MFFFSLQDLKFSVVQDLIQSPAEVMVFERKFYFFLPVHFCGMHIILDDPPPNGERQRLAV